MDDDDYEFEQKLMNLKITLGKNAHNEQAAHVYKKKTPLTVRSASYYYGKRVANTK